MGEGFSEEVTHELRSPGQRGSKQTAPWAKAFQLEMWESRVGTAVGPPPTRDERPRLGCVTSAQTGDFLNSLSDAIIIIFFKKELNFSEYRRHICFYSKCK